MNTNQKGGTLVGDALTDEVLDSASNILQGRPGQTKGLQQFYAPETLARFAREILGDSVVLDLTAGDGSLLQHFNDGSRFGFEIDADQVRNAGKDGRPYCAVRGDVQHIAPLAYEMQLTFARMALNPPFGLKWKDIEYKGGAEVNSAELTMYYASKLLSHDGIGLIVTGGSGGWESSLKPFFESHESKIGGERAKLVPYSVITVDDLWPETQVSNQIVLFGWWVEQMYGGNPQPTLDNVPHFTRTLGTLQGDQAFLDTINTYRNQTLTYAIGRWGSSSSNARAMVTKFNALRDEYDRRTADRKPKREMDFDVYAAGRYLTVKPRPFVKYKLAHSAALDDIESLDKQPVTHFGMNTAAWSRLKEMEGEGTITIHPPLHRRVEKIIHDAERLTRPLGELKPQQRLGWLEDLKSIKCVKTDEAKGFIEGQTYPLNVRPHKQIEIDNQRATKDKNGTPTLASYRKERWILKFYVDRSVFYEKKEDIEYLVQHFEIPDPGTVREQYPELIEHWGQILDGLSADKDWDFKPFQKDDLTRGLVKGSFLLAWEQGLGKTLAGLTFAKAHQANEGKELPVLIICPADLIPQWQREAKRFYGIELRQLTNGPSQKRLTPKGKVAKQRPSDFLEAARHIEAGGTGWYITHYEAYSRSGRMEETLPLEKKVGYKQRFVRASRYWADGTDLESGHWVDVPEHNETQTVTRASHCPRCGNSTRDGYNPGGTCTGRMPHAGVIDPETGRPSHYVGSKCGWTPYEVRTKANYNLIKNTFRHGVVIVDESTKIKSDDSLMATYIRAIKGKYRMAMTGTPIKNYAPDAYWGLWWVLGNATAQFPFNYREGKEKFESDFSSIEWKMDQRGRKQGRKRLPEVSNISRLWRLLAPSVIRRRKEETDEPLVERTFYPTLVPCGISQRKNTEVWLRNFADYFKEKFPEHHLVEKGLVELMAPMLGLQPKLEYCATMPLADPDVNWWYEHDEKAPPQSNWTPKSARVIELALHHAALGEKVLVGSALKAPGKWFQEEINKRLCTPEELEAGVEKCINILAKTEDEDELKTLNPKQRAHIVHEFQKGDAQVLVSSHALNLGHNLDNGSVVILTGLPWDYATFDQFIARVHRLTSEKAVRVYVVLAAGTIDERKWKMLVDKASAANLALDGRLIEEQEEHINQAEIIDQMVKAGIPVTGNEVDEDELEAAWQWIASPADLPELVLEGAAITDLTELSEDDVVPETEAQDTAGTPTQPTEPEPTITEPTPPEATTVEEPVADEDEATVNEHIVVTGRISEDSLVAALYGPNAVVELTEYPLNGVSVALVEAPQWAQDQTDRYGSFGVGATLYDDVADARVSYSEWVEYWQNREAEMAEKQQTIDAELEEMLADDIEEPVEDIVDPTVEELVNSAEMANLREPVRVAVAVEDDYAIGF